MKKNYYFRLVISLTSVFIVTISGLLIYGKLAINNDKYVSVYANDNKEINIKDNTIYLSTNVLDSSLTSISKYLKTEVPIKDMYDNIVTNAIKNDKNIKMEKNKENSLKELTTSIDKEKAEVLFEDYINVDDNININILFENDTENIEIDSIDYKINKEEILRARVVKTALEQVGKTGETYWEWYGFNHRVEWCAVFVSWVANQHGLIEADEAPKFVWVKIGVDFYKNKNQFKYRKEYTPKGGDVIFFDWNNNGVIDHVGIVEKVKDGYVYTVEGNVHYLDVENRKYKTTSSYIYGYGIPNYENL